MHRYEATWESIDRHRAPEWYRDAGLGVFVHYSPSWFEDEPVPESYDAAAWVDAATDAGARYLVFTSKHHDGFPNWPSAYTDFGAESFFGPRDVVSPLVEEARRAGLKVGFYYSWLDQHHPDYPDPDDYVEGYAHAQLQELWDLYRPSILWGDGEWDFPASHWRAAEIVSWYYDRAEEAGRDVCVNDRLGRDTRYYYVRERDEGGTPHGDYWTPEHQVAGAPMDHAWEACETMHDGWSWTADPNWRDIGDLLWLLVDVVSKGGNLLLNVGPKPDGTISDPERERLAAIGDWLAVNGEAIYGARPFDPPEQDVSFVPAVDWDDPAGTWEALVDHITEEPLRLTRSGTDAYAIHRGWPDGEVRIPGVAPRDGAEIELLGVGEVEWTRDGDGLLVHPPGGRPCEHAVTFRIPLPMA